MIIILPFLFITAFVILITRVKVTPQDTAIVIERLGTYHRVEVNSVYFLIPFIEKVVSSITLREQDFNLSRTTKTADNISKTVNAEVYYQVVNPELFTYNVKEPLKILKRMVKEQLTENISMYEKDALADKDVAISERMIAALNVDTAQWGVKITRIYITIY